MDSRQEIIDRQISSVTKDADGKDKVNAAVQRATIFAQNLLENGEQVSQEEIMAIADTFLTELDDALGRLASLWKKFNKATNTYCLCDAKYKKACEECVIFEKEKHKHDRGIERQRKHLQDLSGPLLVLQQKHVYQHAEKVQEKAECVGLTTKYADGQEILDATTVYSSMKNGHERWASIVADRTQEFMNAGKQLRDMIGLEKELLRKKEHLLERREAASARMEAAGKEHHMARMDSASSFEATCAFLGVIGGENAVTKAKESLKQTVQLYQQYPEKGYKWACDQIREQIEGAEAVKDVKGKGEAVEKAMEELELGAGSNEEEVVEKGEADKDTEVKGKGKKKSKGKGKGKK
ncbi:MAG: hypothetical protein Q9225_007576 [Loekoesia sp. 1 TL-2023]